MKLNDAVFGAVLLVLGVAVLSPCRRFRRSRARTSARRCFPALIASGLIVCALLLIVGGVRRHADVPWSSRCRGWRSRRT
jgi:putative tricarboxylic transport membrane protein